MIEQIIILALIRLGEKAYGMKIRREIADRTGREISIGAVYTTLDRMEKKGYVSSRIGDPTPERGGRAKKYFRLEAKGEEAFNERRALIKKMQGGLESWAI